MKTSIVTTRLFGENIYIIWDENTLEAAIIDPGMMDENERQEVEDVVKQEKLSVKYVLLTHSHIDHACSARWTAEKFGAQVYGSKNDDLLAQSLTGQATMFHLRISPQPLTIDHDLKQGDELTLGNDKIQVLATPGHTEGGLTYYIPQEGVAFVGDTIFQRSVGRTDLPGGNMHTLTESIKSRLFVLPGETILAPGHGPTTTVEEERLGNPFV